MNTQDAATSGTSRDRGASGDQPEPRQAVSAAGAVHRLLRVGVWVAAAALVAVATKAVLVASLGVSLFWIVVAVAAAAAAMRLDRVCRPAISRCDKIAAAAAACYGSVEDCQRRRDRDYEVVKTYLTMRSFYVNPRYAFPTMQEMRRCVGNASSTIVINRGLVPAEWGFWVRWSPTGVLVDQVMKDLERESPELLSGHRYRRHAAAG